MRDNDGRRVEWGFWPSPKAREGRWEAQLYFRFRGDLPESLEAWLDRNRERIAESVGESFEGRISDVRLDTVMDDREGLDDRLVGLSCRASWVQTSDPDDCC